MDLNSIEKLFQWLFASIMCISYYDQKETYTYSKHEEYRGIKISNVAKQPFNSIPDVIDTTRVKRVEIRIWKTERIGAICLMRLSRQIYQ